MENGIEHLSSLMETLPDSIRLAMMDEGEDRPAAVWSKDASFEVMRAISLRSDVQMVLYNDRRDLAKFWVRTGHVTGAFAGDTVRLNDAVAAQIAYHIHEAIEQGALL